MQTPKTPYIPPLTRPSRARTEQAAANILMRKASTPRINNLDAIAKLAGDRPPEWVKPRYGDFEYWLARNCGWITDTEINTDYADHQAMRIRARNTSLKYKWDTEPRYKAPKDTGEYAPELNMKLVKDRNLTDSARRIALFVMHRAYRDNREGRYIALTVSFIMKGLSLSRRTVQRNLSLLEKHGYIESDVVPSEHTKMCIGLIINLLSPLFPRHHKKKWAESRRKSDASQLTQNHNKFFSIYKNKVQIPRILWAEKCCEGIIRSVIANEPIFNRPIHSNI